MNGLRADVVTIAIHAPRWLRKRRLSARPHRPLSSLDVDERDRSEVQKLGKAEPIVLADLHIVNDGSREELHSALQRALTALAEAAHEPYGFDASQATPPLPA